MSIATGGYPRISPTIFVFLWVVGGGCSDSTGLGLDPNDPVGSKKYGSWVWSAKTCPVWPQTNINSAANISIDTWQPKDHAGSVNYAHNTKRLWPILFNQNVEYVRYNFNTFSVADTGDSFQIRHRNGTTTYTLGSEPSGLTGPFQVKYTGSHTGATYLEHQWQTNNSGTSSGYKIDKLVLYCLASPPSPANTTYVMRNWAYDGYLLGTDDVIYVYTTQPANKEMSILVWPQDSGTDFDLFISTNPANPMPSWSSNNGASIRGTGSPELIVLSTPTSSRTIYIAVGSYSGKGQFRFSANVHAPGYPQSVRVITDWNTSSTHKAIIRTQIKKVVQSQYFATDGRHFIRNVDIYWNRPGPITLTKPVMVWSGYNCGANQCIAYPCGTNPDHTTYHPYNWCGGGCYPATDPSCTCTNTQSVNQDFASDVVTHEVGHCYYNLCNEEYQSPTACGHSTMGSYPNALLNMVDYCDINNGGKNPPTGLTPHASSANNWASLESQFPSTPAYPTSYTPDPFFKTAPQSAGDEPFSSAITITEH